MKSGWSLAAFAFVLGMSALAWAVVLTGNQIAPRTPTPSPSPLPTPWLWTDEHGAGVYVCYSPCTLTNPFQAPPSAEATP